MVTNNDGNPFSAVDPALGYLYQVRTALLWSLQRLRRGKDFLVSVEVLDDVAFEDVSGEPTDLLQTKHHRSSSANLSNASPDIWKTLRIWIEGTESGDIPSTTNLVLVTTSTAAENSAASHLKNSDRNVAEACKQLDLTSSSSTNRTNEAAYIKFNALDQSEKVSLLERVLIIDGYQGIASLEGELKSEVYWAVDQSKQDAFLDRLEGWWYKRVINQLAGPVGDKIGSIELDQYMADLRNQFKDEALPVDDDLIQYVLDDATSAAHEGSTFVRQLQIINTGKHRIANCIRDYYRAFEQRSRWLRDDLVVELELGKYEKRLVEEWNLVFEAMRDDLGEQAADDAKETAAKQVLAWAERTTFNIRPGVTEPFISRGSMQILADHTEIGWHPEFSEKLASILDASEVQS